jgi:hypothetical protein
MPLFSDADGDGVGVSAAEAAVMASLQQAQTALAHGRDDMLTQSRTLSAAAAAAHDAVRVPLPLGKDD